MVVDTPTGGSKKGETISTWNKRESTSNDRQRVLKYLERIGEQVNVMNTQMSKVKKNYVKNVKMRVQRLKLP